MMRSALKRSILLVLVWFYVGVVALLVLYPIVVWNYAKWRLGR